MFSGYFNYRTHVAESRWEMRAFLGKWWKIYRAERRWAPPYHSFLRRILVARQFSHFERLAPGPLYVEALPTRSRDGSSMGGGAFSSALFEEPVGAVVLLTDRRRHDGTVYMGLLHVANDEESLERLFGAMMEQAWQRGGRRLVGPVGLSPYLGYGTLQDYFHLTPPLHSPYNPPYVPELMDSMFSAERTQHLYRIAVPAELPPDNVPSVRLTSLEPVRLANDLLPLLIEACREWAGFPPPDVDEAELVLRWLQTYPLSGWLAEVDGKNVGFVLLQPDFAPQVARAQGGRNPLWRLWLQWRVRQPVSSGRLLMGTVLPAWRGQGVGTALWRQCLQTAQRAGWKELTIGPVPPDSEAAAFCEERGAEPQQRYVLYGTEL